MAAAPEPRRKSQAGEGVAERQAERGAGLAGKHLELRGSGGRKQESGEQSGRPLKTLFAVERTTQGGEWERWTYRRTASLKSPLCHPLAA